MGFISFALLIILVWYLFVHLEKYEKKLEAKIDKKMKEKAVDVEVSEVKE